MELVASTHVTANAWTYLVGEPAGEAARERERLVRLCGTLTEDWDAAEDLAHDALMVAARTQDRLRGPEHRWAWVAGIARNVCLHWRRSRGREWRHRVTGDWSTGTRATGEAGRPRDAIEDVPADLDLEQELERGERAALLDRAMGYLPPDTRRVLVGHYVEGWPQARLALQLGLSEGAVAMRLQRGRAALRGVLAGPLRDEAACHGLVDPERGEWQPTRIWCPTCGKRRLEGRFNEAGQLCLDCIDCPDAARGKGLPRSVVVQWGNRKLFQGVKGFKPAWNRLMAERSARFGEGKGAPPLTCAVCRREGPWRSEYEHASGAYQMRAWCTHCGNGNGCVATSIIALALPQGRAFWREHPRLRTLLDTEIHAEGHDAVLTRLRSVTTSAELALVFRRDTLGLLRVHGAPASPPASAG